MPLETLNTVAYTTAATAKGGREGVVRSADAVIDLPLGRPGGSTPEPMANPETLFAAGYAACFSGALGVAARKAGIDATESTVTATVLFGRTDTGMGLAVELVAAIPGVERATVQDLADQAHQMCPYSKATRGNIEVTVKAAE